MSLRENKKVYGAKTANLMYIEEQDGSIPILPFVPVPIGDDWRRYKSDIEDLGDTLVRSSSSVEDRKGASFAGLFNSLKYNGFMSVESVLDSVNNPDVIQYANLHNIKRSIRMGLLFQQHAQAMWNWSMLRHPHESNLIFVMGRQVGNHHNPFSYDYVFDENTYELYDIEKIFSKRTYAHHKDDELLSESIGNEMLAALAAYERIEHMSAFNDGYVYQMEFGTQPFSVYQFRPFRKKEEPTWKLEQDALRDIYEYNNIVGFSFGITPPEGIDVRILRIPPTGLYDIFKIAREKGTDETKLDKIIEVMHLNEHERVYAEDIVKSDPNLYGAYETEVIANSAKKLLKGKNLDKTAVLLESMHFNWVQNDLLYPRAKVWLADGGLEFLSHKWFRAMQAHDIALIGGGWMRGKTRDSIRVYSDGIHGFVGQK